ncbi:VOC family protein [Streptomonospora sediminis]
MSENENGSTETGGDATVLSLHTMLGYRDAAAAIDWLERALGFTNTMRFEAGDGSVAHAELRRGAAAVIVFDEAGADYDHPAPRGATVGICTYIAVADTAAVDAVWADALAAGATPVWEPAWTEWGNYACRVRDPEEREWTFGIHRPGQEIAGGRAW